MSGFLKLEFWSGLSFSVSPRVFVKYVISVVFKISDYGLTSWRSNNGRKSDYVRDPHPPRSMLRER